MKPSQNYFFSTTARLPWQTLAASIVLLLTSGVSPARDSHVEEIMKQYSYDAWEKKTSMHDGFFIFELSFEGWKARDLFENRGMITRTFSGKDQPGGPAAFVVESFVADSVPEVYKWLIGWLASRTDTYTLKTLQDNTHPKHRDQFGNLAFTTKAGQAGGDLSVVFVRGNIGIRISAAFTENYENLNLDTLLAIGKQIDKKIDGQRLLEDGKKPSRPIIRKLSLPNRRLTAGKRGRIDLDIVDPAGKKFLTNWKVRGDARGSVRKDKEGNWNLKVEGEGKLIVTVEVVSSIGTYASKVLKLNVNRPPQR